MISKRNLDRIEIKLFSFFTFLNVIDKSITTFKLALILYFIRIRNQFINILPSIDIFYENRIN
jgi:hypothetical protein